MPKRTKWLSAFIAVLVIGLGFAAYSLFFHSGDESLTVSEFRAQAASLASQQVQVGGTVVPGSVEWNNATSRLRFTLADDKERLIVMYTGVIPDDFKPGEKVVVRGSYRTDDVFEALSFGEQRSICKVCH